MFAYIPARGGSKRIPRKNIRKLGGKPIVCHVIESLIEVGVFSGIAVSTDDEEIRDIVENYQEVTTLGLRDSKLSDDVTGFLDLINLDAVRFSKEFGHDESIMLVLPTAALVKSVHYLEAIKKFKNNPNGLIISVTKYDISPMLALTSDSENKLTPLFPDMYTKPTKDLPLNYIDAGCFYLFDRTKLNECTKLLDLHPIQGVILPRNIGIDLDTEEDWGQLVKVFNGFGNDN